MKHSLLSLHFLKSDFKITKDICGKNPLTFSRKIYLTILKLFLKKSKESEDFFVLA